MITSYNLADIIMVSRQKMRNSENIGHIVLGTVRQLMHTACIAAVSKIFQKQPNKDTVTKLR